MKEEDIKKIVSFELGVDEKNVTLWSTFKKLKADKQDCWETVIAVEDTLKKAIPDKDFEKLCRPETTVGELMKYANSHV